MVHKELLEHRASIDDAKRKIFMYLVARVTACTRDILADNLIDDSGLAAVAFRELESEEVAISHHSVPALWENPDEVCYSLTGRGIGTYLRAK